MIAKRVLPDDGSDKLTAIWGVVFFAGPGFFLPLEQEVTMRLLPALLLPSLAWGLADKLAPSSYPDEWGTVADIVSSGDDGRMIVLPWHGSYRGCEWNRNQAVLDPAPRYFPGEVFVDDSVVLEETVLPPEAPVVLAVEHALGTDDPSRALRALGVRWVLVEKGMAVGPVPEGEVVHGGKELDLVDLGPVPPPAPERRSAQAPVIVAGGLVLAVAAAALVTALALRRQGAPTLIRDDEDTAST